MHAALHVGDGKGGAVVSFYVYETQAKAKCERCQGEVRVEGYEFCEECIHEMIMPGYRAPFLPDDAMRKEFRRANGYE